MQAPYAYINTYIYGKCMLALQCSILHHRCYLILFQFDYEGFLYEWFEEGDKLPPLESLAVRNLKLSADGPNIDNCK